MKKFSVDAEEVGRTREQIMKSTTEDDLKILATAIIARAIEDWVGLIELEKRRDELERKLGVDRSSIKNIKLEKSTFNDIRYFFNSGYGDALCELVGINAKALLTRIEGWLTEYRETGKTKNFSFSIA